MTSRIGILLGSTRANGNAAGISSWLVSVLRASPHLRAAAQPYEFTIVDPVTPPHPLGPIVDSVMASQVQDPALYASPGVRQWSEFVTSCAGLVVVTPQYNWGYPGELKNALDHLYYEWRGKPVLLITYGGHGGNKCAAQLKEVLQGGLKMRLVTKAVEITLPRPYISGDKRVSKEAVTGESAGDGPDPFLQQYIPVVEDAFGELLALTKAPIVA